MNQKLETTTTFTQDEKNMFAQTYSNMPWKSYKMYSNVEKENTHLFQKIIGISSQEVQNKLILNEQKHDLAQNNQLLTKVRKRQQDSVRVTEENRKMFMKLYTSKPHINSQQQQQQYQQKKQIIKRLTRFPLQNSKMNNNQKLSVENLKNNNINNNQVSMKENKSFIISDQKCQEIVDQIDKKEINEMRESLRDGSYKLLNFSTKELSLMATRPASGNKMIKNKQLICTNSSAQDQYKDIQNIQNLIKNHIGNNNTNKENFIIGDPKTLPKRAQTAMKSGRRQQDNSQYFDNKIIITNEIPHNYSQSDAKNNTKSFTYRMRNDSIQQRKMSLPDQQNLESFIMNDQNDEYHEYDDDYDQQQQYYHKQQQQQQQQYNQQQQYQVPKAYYIRPAIPDRQQSLNVNSQSQIGQSLAYSQSNINSINQPPSIDQKSRNECTISINQILQQGQANNNNNLSSSYLPMAQRPKQSRNISCEQQYNKNIYQDTIPIQELDYQEEEENKSSIKYIRQNNDKNKYIPFSYNNQSIQKQYDYDDKLDIQKISKTQPIQQQNDSFNEIQRNKIFMINTKKSYDGLRGDIKNITNDRSSIQSNQGESLWNQQNNNINNNNDNKSTIKSRRINQINQQIIQICQKNNQNKQQQNHSPTRYYHHNSTLHTKRNDTFQIDFNQSPTTIKQQQQQQQQYLPVCQERNSKDTKLSYSITKQLNQSTERTVRKSYQQEILNGKESIEQNNKDQSFNNFIQQQPNKYNEYERKQQDQQYSFSNRKKSQVGQSMNINSKQGDNSINFLQMIKPSNKNNNASINYEDHQLIDLPIHKRINRINEDQSQRNKIHSQNSFRNYNNDNKSTTSSSKNPIVYIQTQLGNQNEKGFKNEWINE